MMKQRYEVGVRSFMILCSALAGACTTDPGISSAGAGAGAGGAITGSGSGGGGGSTGVPGGGAAGTGDAGFTLKIPDGGATSTEAGAAEKCGITATVRDFKDDHPDFEKFLGALKGIVANDLGGDGKPVYAPAGPTAVTSGKDAFDQWYRDVPGVNMKLSVPLPLQAMPGGKYVFDDSNFFPMDNMGFGNQGRDHNFHFTTEIHATFRYSGGEKFTFRGDDDVWIFINKKLALDLGGVHGALMDTIDFDRQAAALGITAGGTYAFDVFHAERHTNASNFRIETSIACLRTVQ